MNDDHFFTRLAEQTDTEHDAAERAPSRLRSTLYSALVMEQAASGPLRSLPATRAAGRSLCVFEHVLRLVPDERVTSMNPCRVCHARLLAERFESPPIYWPHCPYVEFKGR